MGHMTAVAFRLKVKHSAPPQVQEFLKNLFVANDLSSYTQDALVTVIGDRVLDEVDSLVRSCNDQNAEFNTWAFTTVEEDLETTTYTSYGSLKHPPTELVFAMMPHLLPHLAVEEGDVLYRTHYEDAPAENVLIFTNGRLWKEWGMLYYANNLEDDRNPYWQNFPDWERDYNYDVMLNEYYAIPRLKRFEYLKKNKPDYYLPPWNFAEIKENNDAFTRNDEFAAKLIKPLTSEWELWSNNYI